MVETMHGARERSTYSDTLNNSLQTKKQQILEARDSGKDLADDEDDHQLVAELFVELEEMRVQLDEAHSGVELSGSRDIVRAFIDILRYYEFFILRNVDVTTVSRAREVSRVSNSLLSLMQSHSKRQSITIYNGYEDAGKITIDVDAFHVGVGSTEGKEQHIFEAEPYVSLVSEKDETICIEISQLARVLVAPRNV